MPGWGRWDRWARSGQWGDGGGGASPNLVTDGLVAEYRFDDGSGQVLTDYSGNDYHLQLGSTSGVDINDPSWVTEGQSFSGSIGIEDYNIKTAVVPAALMPDAFTYMAVFESVDPDARMNALTWSSDATIEPCLAFYWTDESQPMIYFSGSNYRIFNNSESMNDGVWRVVTFVVPGAAQTSINTSQCYVDKTACTVASTVATGAQDAKDAFIIGNPLQTTSRFAGKQGFSALYNRALTESEIFQNVDYITALMGGRGVVVPFDPASVPSTRSAVFFDSGISHLSDSAVVDSWTGKGGGLVNASGPLVPGAYVFPSDTQAIHGFVGGATHGMRTAAQSLSQPFTMYALVNWQWDINKAPENDIGCLGFDDNAPEDVSLHISSADADDQIQASSGNTQVAPDSEIVIGPVPDRTWTRIKAVFNGASSSLQVEGTTQAGTLDSHDISGVLKVLDWSVYIAHWQLIDGVVTDEIHNAMWGYLEGLKDDLPEYTSTIVQAADGKYRGLGNCAIYDTNKLVAAYYCGDGHSTADSDLRLTTSADGATWAAEAVIADVHVAGYHMRDTSITVLSSGRWVVVWTETNPTFTGEYNKAWSMYSDNEGVAWSTPVQLAVHSSVTTTAVGGHVLELASGNLVVNTYGRATGDGNNIVLVYRSTDSGASWAYDSTVPSSSLMNEGVMQLLSDGTALMMIRKSDGLYKSICADPTATPLVWGTPSLTDSDARSKPYFIQRADDSLVLCTRSYEDYHDATGQSPMCILTSTDDGATWSDPVHPEPSYNAQMYGNPIMYDSDLHVFWSQETADGAVLFWRDLSDVIS